MVPRQENQGVVARSQYRPTTQATSPFDRPTTQATSPFDRGDADLVLRTSDLVAFLVHRQILVIASPFFECMLSLPQPATDPADQPLDKPVIEVSEDSHTMETFLRLIYPTLDAEITEFSLLRNVLDAAVKYESSVVLAAMKRAMVSRHFLETQPLAIFAIACRHRLEDEAKAAARQLAKLDSDLQQHGDPVLDELTAGQYYRLLRFKREQPSSLTSFNFCHPLSDPVAPSPTATARIGVTSPFSGPRGDLILMSSDSRMFHVHRAVLGLASPSMLDGILVSDTTRTAAVPVYPMREDSVCVDILLRLCYPIPKPEFPSPDAYRAVLVAARKYRLCEVERVARSHWLTFVESSVLSFYFLAVELGWKEEAVACARRLVLPRPVKVKKKLGSISSVQWAAAYSSYTPVMESISSILYRNLLSYVDNYGKAAASTTHQLSTLPARHVATSSVFGENCHARYPSQFSTAAPPAWLQDQFAEIKRALERRPSSDVLALDTPLASSFIAFVADDKPPCTGRSSSCSTTTNVQWAVKVLQKYAEAVDQVILKVDLKMVGAGKR